MRHSIKLYKVSQNGANFIKLLVGLLSTYRYPLVLKAVGCIVRGMVQFWHGYIGGIDEAR